MAKSIGEFTVNLRCDTHGAIEDTRIGVLRRTLALWLLTLASRLLRTRISMELVSEEQR